MMDQAVILYQRSDLAWGDLAEQTYFDQAQISRSTLNIQPACRLELLQRIQLWNRTFKMSYFQYRQHIKEIAEWNRANVRDVDCVLRNRHQIERLKLENCILLPIDDDDWYSPEIAKKLRQIDFSMVDLVSWQDAVYAPTRVGVNREGKRQTLVTRPMESNGFWTNSYGLTSRGISHFDRLAQEKILNRHATVLRTFQEEVKPFKQTQIEGIMSVTHKSCASFTKMVKIHTTEDFIKLIPLLLSEDDPDTSAVDWTRPYTEQVEQLNQELVKGIQVDSKSVHSSKMSFNGPKQASNDLKIAPRSKLINAIIEQYSYQSYLEIGCGNNQNFTNIRIADKVGVDTNQGGTHRMTSDEFFKNNQQSFDLIFVDGLHLEEQVTQDILNSLTHLRENGLILVHDCLPVPEEHQFRERVTGGWMGDVWKAMVKLRQRKDLDIAVLKDFCGMGVIIPRPNSQPLTSIPELSWETFVARKSELLRLVTLDEFFQFLQRDRYAPV